MDDSSHITTAEEPATGTDSVEVPAPALSAPPKPPSVGELRRERKRLWDEREKAVYHVGGLAVDLRRRGIDDVELVNHRAEGVLAIDARINEIDAALARVDTRRGGPSIPAAGYCVSCGAPFQHEAAFCFRCGARVAVPVGPTESAPDGEQPTTVIHGSETRP